MSYVGDKSLRVRHRWQRCRLLVVRCPWNIGSCILSVSAALGYAGGSRVSFTSVTFVIGLTLLILNCYAWVLLVKPLQAVRPPAYVVRVGSTCFFLGLLVWVASVLLTTELTLPPNERWILGDAGLQREVHSAGAAPFAGPPVLQVNLEPTSHPFVVGVVSAPSIARASGWNGSVLSLIWPTWGLAVSSGLPTLVLAQLRRERIRPSRCRRCDYDLTGNTSGICPECGSATESMERRLTND